MLTASTLILWLLAALIGFWGASLMVRTIRSNPQGRPIPASVLVLASATIPASLAIIVVSIAINQALFGSVRDYGKEIWLAAAIWTGLFALFFLVAGLLLDTPRGRRRCPRCWYDLAKLPQTMPITCPECGSVAKAPRQLERTRPHRRLIISSSAFFLLAAIFPMVPLYRASGIVGLVPASVMLIDPWILPDDWILENAAYPKDRSLLARYNGHDLAEWQNNRVKRCVEREFQQPRSLATLGKALRFADASYELTPTAQAAGIFAVSAFLAEDDPTVQPLLRPFLTSTLFVESIRLAAPELQNDIADNRDHLKAWALGSDAGVSAFATQILAVAPTPDEPFTRQLIAHIESESAGTTGQWRARDRSDAAMNYLVRHHSISPVANTFIADELQSGSRARLFRFLVFQNIDRLPSDFSLSQEILSSLDVVARTADESAFRHAAFRALVARGKDPKPIRDAWFANAIRPDADRADFLISLQMYDKVPMPRAELEAIVTAAANDPDPEFAKAAIAMIEHALGLNASERPQRTALLNRLRSHPDELVRSKVEELLKGHAPEQPISESPDENR